MRLLTEKSIGKNSDKLMTREKGGSEREWIQSAFPSSPEIASIFLDGLTLGRGPSTMHFLMGYLSELSGLILAA